MKKIIILSFAFSFFAAGATLPLTEASRDAYHAYMTQPENIADYRHFAEGITSNRLRNHLLGNRSMQVRRTANNLQQRNYRGSRENFNRANRGQDNSSRLTVRTSSERITPNTARTIHTSYQPTAVITPTVREAVQASLYTYENDRFSLMLPTGWTLTSANEKVHTYSNPDSSYQLEVKHFGAKTCGTSLGFATCATQLGKAENYRAVGGTGKLEVTSRIIRDARKSDTVLNQLAIMTDTYTEQFNAYLPFVGDKTFSRYFVSGENGSVFLVEATSAYRDAAGFAEITKRVFDSFRVYPTN